MSDLAGLVQGVLGGQQRAIARALTLIERGDPRHGDLLAMLQPHLGQAHLIGMTGAPGSGKSTLTEALATAYRRQGMTVGIIAVDPSSPLTGGALLGDRIRMGRLSGDRGVFIRSMASRGRVGGLARATAAAAQVLDAAGFDKVIIETVGAGQDEVDIARAAHSCIVVQVPNAGDDIQAIKAGQLEIADLLLVNKSDQPGAERAAQILRAMIEMTAGEGWVVPVIKTVATTGVGVDELVAELEAHRVYRQAHGQRERMWYDRARQDALLQRLAEGFLKRLEGRLSAQVIAELLAAQDAGRLTLDQVVAELLDRYDESVGEG